ncbi:MAG TPA: FtsX-like permease family protein [Bryobacteraceae bacterium]|nr:FtsX-like permease family protein [Bryobacteraceae bacterium]
MFRYLPLIVKNCWRNRRRTSLTIASIGVSMCLLGVLIAVYHALYLSDATPNQALRVVTRNRISLTVPIPLFYRDRIRQVPGVQEVMSSQWFNGVYKDARDPKNFFARFGVDPPEKLFTIFGELKIPEDQKQAFIRDRTGTVIGRDLASKFNFHIGDRITIIGDIYPGNLELTVRGIFDSPRQSEVLYFNWAYVREGLPESRKGEVGTFDILCDSAGVVPHVANTIDDEFHNSPVQTRTETEQAFMLSFVGMLGNVKLFLVSICAAVMFTILLVSGNTMAMSVRERVREVGVLKTLGFTGGNILFIILGEACAISIAGGTLGFLLSTLMTGGVQKSPAGMFLPPIRRFDPAVASVCILVALGIGLLSAFIPAWNASRTNIVEALRSTD